MLVVGAGAGDVGGGEGDGGLGCEEEEGGEFHGGVGWGGVGGCLELEERETFTLLRVGYWVWFGVV